MIDKEKNIEFLNKLSNILTKKVSPVNTIGAINKLFKTYLNIEKTEFVIWDNNNMLLKDFVMDRQDKSDWHYCRWGYDPKFPHFNIKPF